MWRPIRVRSSLDSRTNWSPVELRRHVSLTNVRLRCNLRAHAAPPLVSLSVLWTSTLSERSLWEICNVCWWEDDGQDDADADVVRDGSNWLSLAQARANYRQIGASDPKFVGQVRKPNASEGG